MSSFAQEFKKYQKQERLLTVSLVLVSVLAPVSFTWLMNNKVNWIICAVVAVLFISAATAIHVIRAQVASKLLKKYETLDVGSILTKKITPKNSKQFVITNTGYNHFYLKCLNTGEQSLVSKHRIKEDFDITN